MVYPARLIPGKMHCWGSAPCVLKVTRTVERKRKMSRKAPELFLVLANREPRAGINVHVTGLAIGQRIEPKHSVGRVVPDIMKNEKNQFYIATMAQLTAREIGLDTTGLETSFKTYKTKDPIEGIMVFLFRD
jgi:hypothetical protein